MSNIIEVRKTERRTIVGRECDACGFVERSTRSEIAFNHDKDSRWAKFRYLLDDYTDPKNNYEHFACSAGCSAKLIENFLKHAKDGDCLNGIPATHFREMFLGYK